MRDTTEAVEAGTVKLVGTHTQTIKEAQKLLDDTIEYEKMSNPYGKACERIIKFIKEV